MTLIQEEKKFELGKTKSENFFSELVELTKFLKKDWIRVSISRRDGIFLGDENKSLLLDYDSWMYHTNPEEKYDKIENFIKKHHKHITPILDTVLTEERQKAQNPMHRYVEFRLSLSDLTKSYQDFVGESYLIQKEKKELDKKITTPMTHNKIKL